MEPAPPDDGEEQADAPDRREAAADRREAEADQRERQMDARERVLDRWEAEIVARAAEFHFLDDDEEEAARRAAHERRERERALRRDQAEARRDAAIEREIDRTTHRPAPGAERDGAAADAGSTTVFPRLLTALHDDAPLREVLELILAAGVDSVPGCAAVSVALANDGRLQPAASTAPWAADLDAAQLRSDSGPLPAAAGPGAIASTANLAAEPGWPAELDGATARRSVISFGLVIGSAGPAVLSLYSETDGHFTAPALRIGDVLAAHAASALARTLERRAYEARTEAWQRALASRDLIGQAKGILMEQRAVSGDEAFTVLREASQRLNVKLRDVAEQVVAHRRLPGG